jgi:chemotaxis protein MotB
VISLKDSILFTAGNADLSPAARHTLDGLIQQLHAALGGQSRPIRVEGHTDNSPIATSKYPSNWELSTARATTIVRFLVASHHFQPQLLSAAGYGEFKPVKDNSSIEGKQKNRRVDIVVLKPDLAQQEPPALNDPTAPKNGRAEIHVED